MRLQAPSILEADADAPSPESARSSPSGRKALLHLALPALLAFAVLLPYALAPIHETDLGWHLALGRLIAQDGIPFRNALSWTAPDHPWYATSWLFDWLAFRLHELAGLRGVQLLTAAFLLVVALALSAAARQAHRLGAWIVPFLAVPLAARVTERPHIASWALLALTLALGMRAVRRGWGWRARAVPIIALGSNLHSGAAFSAAVLAAFCAQAAFETRAWRREAALALAGALALLANPGGLFNLRYLLDHLQVQQVIVLAEFLPPTWSGQPAFFLLAPLALVAAALHRRRWPALLILAVLFSGLGFFAQRLVYKLYLVAVPSLAALAGGLAGTGTRRVVGLVASGAVLAATLLGFSVPRIDGLQAGARFEETVLPVRAVEFAREHHLFGRLFNAFSDGGYIAWAMPGQPVFQDGRVQAYPPEHFSRLQEAERSPESFQRYLRELDVEWAITLRIKERLGGYRLLDSPDWALVYWDENSEIFLRRDVPRFAPLIQAFEYRHFRPYGRILGNVSAAPPEALPAYDSEVARYRATAPEDPFAAIVRCALGRRMGAADLWQRCDEALALSASEVHQALMMQVLKMGAPPGPAR